MTLQSPQARQARRETRDPWPTTCHACGGVMILVMASPVGNVGTRGLRVFACEYLCDCGYREVINRRSDGEIIGTGPLCRFFPKRDRP
jgi:hypothetical protein